MAVESAGPLRPCEALSRCLGSEEMQENHLKEDLKGFGGKMKFRFNCLTKGWISFFVHFV